MTNSRKKVSAELFHVPEQLVKKHVERLENELLKELDVPPRPPVPTRIKIQAEAQSAWEKIKVHALEAIEPLWDKKEEIIIAIATKLIQGWIERRLNKH